MTIDGVAATYTTDRLYCSQSAGLSCRFFPVGTASFPQIRFSFNRTLTAGSAFTTAPSTEFLGDLITYYENECQYDAGGAYYSYNTSGGSMQVAVTQQTSDLYGTDIKLNFSGTVNKGTPAYARSITSGTANLHLCTHDDCNPPIVTPASFIYRPDTMNRNQLYNGVTIGQKESKCYYFTPPSSQTYSLQFSSPVTVTSMNVNYGYRTSSGFSGGFCGTAANGSCNLVIPNANVRTAIEITAGNNLAGSFSMQLTP